MQFMGDWAKGEFTAPPTRSRARDYACVAAPALLTPTRFNSFAMFNVKAANARGPA